VIAGEVSLAERPRSIRKTDAIVHDGVILCEMPERPALHFPDDLAASRRQLTFIAVDDYLKLKDATMTVD
jgi:hypothetical protein